MNNIQKGIIVILLLALSACAPSQSAIQTSIAQTQAAQPTSTPVPTFTPVPTLTPAPTPDNNAYISQLKPKIKAWLAAYTDFMNLHAAVGADRLLLIDPKWNADILKALDNFSKASDDLSNIQTIPPDLQKTNEYLLKVAEESKMLVQSYKLLLQGDASIVEQINTHMDNIQIYNNLAAEELSKYLP